MNNASSFQEVIDALMQSLTNLVGERLENDSEVHWAGDVQWVTTNLLIHEHGLLFVKRHMPKQYNFWCINKDYMKKIFQALQNIWIQYDNDNAIENHYKLFIEEADTLTMLSQYISMYGIDCSTAFKNAFNKRHIQLLQQVSTLKLKHNSCVKMSEHNEMNYDKAKTYEQLVITYQRIGQVLRPMEGL